MSAIYFAIPTNAGQARIANSIALGIPLKITHMAIGDGNGQPVTPNPAQTSLAREVRRAPLNTLFQDPLNPAQLVAEQIIPEATGGWWVREVGLYDDSGTLIAVANTPETYKPLLTSGAGRTQTIRMVLIVSDTSAVELKIDPSVVLATRKYVDDTMKAHKESRNHPDASETEKGFSRHATQEEVNTPESNVLEHPVVTVEKLWSWAEQAGGKVPYVFYLWQRVMAAVGYDLIGRFGTANTIETANQVLLSEDGTKVYAWTGELPKNVYPATDPTEGGFTDKSGVILFTFASDAAAQANSVTMRYNLVIGDKPLPYSASKRDAFQVSRYIDGKTDCHAFADKTEIRNISDAGTYGTFDSQTVISHDGLQNHLFSFQDRSRYEGGGTLSTWGNIIWPEMTGSGTVTQRTDIEIKDVSGVGGTIASRIGLYIRDLARAATNVAINLAQSSGFSLYAPNDGANFVHVGNVTLGAVSTDPNIKLRIVEDSATNTVALNITKTSGHAIYSPGDGKTYLNGNVGIGNLPTDATALLVSKKGGVSFFADTDATSAYTGVIGDHPYRVISDAAARLSVLASSDSYAVVPGGNGTQPLGSSTKRWSEVFAATGTINTSDGREKQPIGPLTDAEKRVADRIKQSIITFKFNSAVDMKGDDARIHVGVIAQEVSAAFEAEGLDPHGYSLFCFDEWGELSEEVETTEDDPDAYAKIIKVQKTEMVTVTKRKIEVREDKALQIEYTEQVEQPVYASLPVCDEAGCPIMHMISPYDERTGAEAVYRQETHDVPVMETQTRYYKRVITPAGGLYGIRYEELLAFVIAAL